MYQQEREQKCCFKTGDIVRVVNNEEPYAWGGKWYHYLNGYYDQRGAIGTVTWLFRIVPRDCILYGRGYRLERWACIVHLSDNPVSVLAGHMVQFYMRRNLIVKLTGLLYHKYIKKFSE